MKKQGFGRIRQVSVLFLLVGILAGCSETVEYKQEPEPVVKQQEKTDDGKESADEDDVAEKEQDMDEKTEKIEIKRSLEISADTLPKGTGEYLEIPERDMPRGLKKSFVFQTIPAKEDIWEQLAEDEMCEKARKVYGPFAYTLYVSWKDVNPDYLEYLKKQQKSLYKKFKKRRIVELPLYLYTYEECRGIVLYQGAEVHDESFSCDFLVKYQAGDSICFSRTTEEQLPSEYLELKLSDVSVHPEWFLDSGDQKLYLGVPFETAQELCSDLLPNGITYYLSAKEEYKEKLREYANELADSNLNCVYEDSFFE